MRFQSSNKYWICNELFTEEDKKSKPIKIVILILS